MTLHYDPHLRDVLPSTSRSGVVLNEVFADEERAVLSSLNSRYSDSRYENPLNAKLLERAREHAKKHQKKKDWKNTIMLVHPFFLHLTHMDLIKGEDAINDAKTYLSKLVSLLNLDRHDSEVGIVVLESASHYAAATSLLLESGLCDRVIFSEEGFGRALNPGELKPYESDQIFFGGGYDKMCLSAAIAQMHKLNLSKPLRAMGDLVLSHPWASNRLTPLYVDCIHESHVSSLDDVLSELGLKP